MIEETLEEKRNRGLGYFMRGYLTGLHSKLFIAYESRKWSEIKESLETMREVIKDLKKRFPSEDEPIGFHFSKEEIETMEEELEKELS